MPRRRSLKLRTQLAVFALLAATAAVVEVPQAGAAPTLPSGFADELVASVASPTAMAFLPDGRMLVTTQPGRLRVIQNGSLVTTAALDLSGRLCSGSERGLLGVAVDPAFGTGTGNNWVYLFYTFRKAGTTCPTGSPDVVNRVSRFTFDTATNTADVNSEQILVDNIASWGGNHNGGDVQFGNDGLLYVSVGDGGSDYAGGGSAGSNDAARDQFKLLGKILRITKTGAVPAGNPFQTANDDVCALNGGTSNTTRRCRETFAWGLRNPFRIAFNPNASGTEFFINDVGQNTWEEIDRGVAGADYGWNVREGHCANGSTTNCGAPPAGMTNPIFDYGRGEGCGSITGGAFVPNGAWPAPYSGSYLYADYVCGRIFRLDDNGNGTFSKADFVSDLGGSSATSLLFGPSPSGTSLYYTSYAGGGAVHRINATVGNRAPTAVVDATPRSGPAPLHVDFTGAGSSDPDSGDSVAAYIWNFGDGSTARTTTTATTSYDYATAGSYTATLTVRDTRDTLSAPVSVVITAGNRPPEPVINTPSASDTFRVGRDVTLSGAATDPENGTLPASASSWTVIKHHGDHTHPFLGPVTGNNVVFTGPPPEDLAAAANSYLEIQLTATDASGLSATVTRNLQPRKVSLRFSTSPSGLTVQVAGTSVTGPSTVVSWSGWVIELFAPSPQGAYRFKKWSDGGAQRHTIVTPNKDASRTAKFGQ